jgi:hypothetical protein
MVLRSRGVLGPVWGGVGQGGVCMSGVAADPARGVRHPAGPPNPQDIPPGTDPSRQTPEDIPLKSYTSRRTPNGMETRQ